MCTCSSLSAVDENGVEGGLLEEPLPEPIVKMAVAPNGRFLACFSRDGMLAVMSSNFATKVRAYGCCQVMEEDHYYRQYRRVVGASAIVTLCYVPTQSIVANL